MKVTAFVIEPCPLCENAGRAQYVSAPLDIVGELEATTAGLSSSRDPNTYTFGVSCHLGHRYSVRGSAGRPVGEAP